jgi:hypothetical protein
MLKFHNIYFLCYFSHNDLAWNIRKRMHNRLRDFRFLQNLREDASWSGGGKGSHTDLGRMRQGHVAAQVCFSYNISAIFLLSYAL